MKNKKYEEDINLLEQIADLASKKNLTACRKVEFKKYLFSYINMNTSVTKH